MIRGGTSMATSIQSADRARYKTQRNKGLLSSIWKFRALYLISIPGIVYFIIFKYIPLFGSIIAFQDYNIFQGMFASKWVGLENFHRMFAHYDFLHILKNTLLIGLY